MIRQLIGNLTSPLFLKKFALSQEEWTRSLRGNKSEFAEFLDSLQKHLYEALMRGYGIDPFCKLLAMRLSNLAAAKYHYLHRHSVLLSKPIQLTVDTTNACQLQCPACVHTANKAYAALFDWPKSTLPLSTYQDFLSQFGVFGFCATLYSYGEPLLNRQFPDFVRESKKYLLFTLVSTNLSMPKLDAEAIVASGLDRMVLSIDGTTQSAYERYRRRGDLTLVLDNVRRLVTAKKKSRSATPYLVWQFLTFEHNVHQVEDAISMARELGIDEVMIETPFSPHEDDPEIRSVASPHQGTYRLSRWNGRWCSSAKRKAVAERAAQIDAAFGYSWQERLLGAAAEADDEIPNRGTCEWLYNNITMDGAARVMPCCMAPDKNEKHLVFQHFDGSSVHPEDTVNSSMATLARTAFASPESYAAAARDVDSSQRPYCASCQEQPSSPYKLENVAHDMRTLDERRVVSPILVSELANWGSMSGS